MASNTFEHISSLNLERAKLLHITTARWQAIPAYTRLNRSNLFERSCIKKKNSIQCKSVSLLRRDWMMAAVNSTVSGGKSFHLSNNCDVHTSRVFTPIIELFKVGE